MIKAKDIMEKKVISVSPDTEITKAVELLLNNHINGVPVVDLKGSLVGILCQSDLIFAQKDIPIPPIFILLDGIFPLSSSKKLNDELKKISATTVEQAMVKNPVSVHPDTPISEIASLMVEKHFHTIPVVDKNKVVGIIGKEDILKILIPQDIKNQEETP
ncbi:MAG: CBS domain-containing protein [Proteobacteria bacterium]|nr:CBS domain-containing protein [Pseudomonadota bacterium]MBU1584131.1 CBS domain-containing protein [Pseudomonadota bacterium]MBU2453192.1 CBS domain-containing protein [Pseudomonadota bacterium]MBU2628916.1 CBS domain-containing protein [Pseudomonadota bacterium]